MGLRRVLLLVSLIVAATSDLLAVCHTDADPSYRATLRIYSIAPDGIVRAPVTVSVYDQATDELLTRAP